MSFLTIKNRKRIVQKNNWKFFANKECEYYPCHKGLEEMNCLFCYCPIYYGCGTRKGGMQCENCLFPHDPIMHNSMMICINNLWDKDKHKNDNA